MPGGGGGGGSGVQRVEPPSYQLPHLQYGLGQARQLYDRGNQVVPFAPQTEAAISGITQRAMQGSPVTQAAQNYATNTLGGGFLGSNPYLDATFNKAALATQNQLSSEFAGAGRNVGAAQGLRSQQLNDLATSIYGGDYQQERNRMQGLVGQASGLANQDYIDLGQLAGAGSQIEGLGQRYADAPTANLNEYLAQISGNMGQTTTTKMPGNPASGIAGGALLGGLLMGGPLGAVLGGVLGGL
jgi:hypothetical protein